MMTTEEWNDKPAGTASIPPRVWLLPAPDAHPDTGYWVRVNTGSIAMEGALEYAPVARAEKLLEALKNVMGYVDTPISWRRLAIDPNTCEWLREARTALKGDKT